MKTDSKFSLKVFAGFAAICFVVKFLLPQLPDEKIAIISGIIGFAIVGYIDKKNGA